MVPSRPRWRGHQIGDSRWGGCRTDQASEEGREGSCSCFGRQRTATRHFGLGRDRHPVHPRRPGQRFRTRETRAGQRGLDLKTAGDPRLERTRLHHCPQTARQLDPDDLGKEPGAEQHTVWRRAQVTQAPVREEPVVEHTRQRNAAHGNALYAAQGARPLLTWPPVAPAGSGLRHPPDDGSGPNGMGNLGNLVHDLEKMRKLAGGRIGADLD